MKLRGELQGVLDALLAGSGATRELSLDAIGAAIGTRAITAAEIEAIIDALERSGRRIVTPDGGAGEQRLRAVVEAARTLRPELGRSPTAQEIAARSGLSADEVRHALALARVMQR